MKPHLLMIVAFVALACNDAAVHKAVSHDVQDPENFSQFMQKFISDPDFRMNRVNFPLAGSNSDDWVGGEARDNYLWTKEDWLFYAEKDFKNDSDKTLKTEAIDNDTIATYRLYRENSGYDVRYKFELKEGKWYLVNYSYQNI